MQECDNEVERLAKSSKACPSERMLRELSCVEFDVAVKVRRSIGILNDVSLLVFRIDSRRKLVNHS